LNQRQGRSGVGGIQRIGAGKLQPTKTFKKKRRLLEGTADSVSFNRLPNGCLKKN